jgi:hypothetical protein
VFQKILARFLLILPFIGLTPCVALGVELYQGFGEEIIAVSNETEIDQKYSWLIEEFEEVESDDSSKFSFDKLSGGNLDLFSFEFKSQNHVISLVKARFTGFNFLRFPSLFIAFCVYRL